MKFFRKRVISDTNGDPYLVRYILFRVKPFGIFLHHIMRSDFDRALHDHPWPFASLMLKGSYVEHTPNGESTFKAGNLLFRPAKWLHRLELEKPVWTLVFVGRNQRRWGFMAEKGWCWWRQYNILNGICEEEPIYPEED